MLPASFAFRLRHLLGVGARAEVVRVLLGVDAPHLTAQAVAESAGYAKRNVHEALASLRAAGVVDAMTVGNERRFSAPRAGWAALLGLAPDDLPEHRDWPALLYAIRNTVRWLANPELEQLSDYMRASEARTLIERIGPALRFAGVRVADRGREGADYWGDFLETIHEALGSLG